ncbi:AsmA family protein [Tabrizicola sp.]|uniref:AsmA family protein n=1 Tax=Tabrizicola sp. TaxID=2005166 RepID=UPI00286BED89|nr:AsmA family protein [Tabrizicola sp.]
MRWIIRVGLGLAVLVLLAAGLLALVPGDRVAGAAAAKFESLTGRKLVLEGSVTPTLWPTLGVKTGPVTIANADWSDEGPMLKADALTIDINLSALFGGEVRITGIEAVRPQIILERSAEGQENWVFGGKAGGTVSAQTPGVGQAYALDKGVIREGTFLFIDHQSGRRVALDAIEAEVAIPEFTGPVTLTGTAVSGGQAVGLTATAGVYSAFTEGRVVPFQAALTAGGSTVTFDGRLGTKPLMAEGALAADMADVAALAALAGAGAPTLPQGLGADSLSVKGQLTLAKDGALFLRGATIVADGNTLSGDADLTPGGARPKLSAQLKAGPLRLAGLSGGTGGDTGGDVSSGVAEGWSDDVIDVSDLGAVDMAVALVAPSVDLGQLKLGPTGLKLTVERARAVFDIREMAAYGGQITGEFVVNGRGGLSVGGNLGFAGLQMQPLLADLAGYDRLVGSGNLDLQFLGVGNSVEAIMQSLKGQGTLELGKGELRGFDLGGMLRTLDAGFVGEGQKTTFDGLAGTFTIADGVLSNSDLKLVAPDVTASGSGEVGIGARTLDYRIRPTALAETDGTGGVMVPLLITGTWAAPKFRLDLEGIAREKMEAEARALEERARAAAKEAEAKAKAELEERLKEELGVEVLPGETVEDATKRRAEEALAEETRKLLEGFLQDN